MKKIIISLFLLLTTTICLAQLRGSGQGNQQVAQQGDEQDSSKNKKDSSLGFHHRDPSLEQITISFKYLDSIRNGHLDSTVNDFYKYFTVPETWQTLGNNGSAGYSLIYSPLMKAGWDAGFHAFDAYRYTLQDTKFYKTNKPFSQLDYQLASGAEQTLYALYTNNLKPNLNVGFEYKLISAPGFFVTQNTNHSSYRLFGNYQSLRKRYNVYFAMVGNSIKSSENGGIQNDSFLTNQYYSERFTIPVNLGGPVYYQPSPFNASVSTGNIYKDFTFFVRQTYDFGKKDSVDINDSTTEYLFYPKLRFQYSFTSSTYNYQFLDYAADSSTYQQWYNINLPGNVADSFTTTTKWRMISNDFSLVQFPDTKNQAQFFLLGARLENLTGSKSTVTNISTSSSVDYHFYNIVLHAEYRNKTKNKLWDIEANGELYVTGTNSGDYTAYASLSRYLNKKFGNIRLTFNNVNRSQSFIYNPLFSFNEGTTSPYKKENITVLKATAENPFINLFAADYFITNLAYFSDYYHTAQDNNLINLLQLGASKKIKLSKRWNWYVDVVLQQTDAAAPIKVPLLFTRNRIAYEGNFFRNLNVSTGIEFRYYTPYKEYNYSPIVGQFMPQDTMTIKNRPDISAFLQFRIKTFSLFLRGENLNAVSFTNGFGFTDNNFGAPHYPYPGFIFRFGIRWWFLN
jgi:hypothetical protein